MHIKDFIWKSKAMLTKNNVCNEFRWTKIIYENENMKFCEQYCFKCRPRDTVVWWIAAQWQSYDRNVIITGTFFSIQMICYCWTRLERWRKKTRGGLAFKHPGNRQLSPLRRVLQTRQKINSLAKSHLNFLFFIVLHFYLHKLYNLRN